MKLFRDNFLDRDIIFDIITFPEVMIHG